MSSLKTDRKGNNGDNGGSSSLWMTTFSDLITLLLTFFVLLFSMSSMDDQKLKIAFNNFGGSSGLLSFKEYREMARPVEVLIEGLYKSLGDKVKIGDDKDVQENDVDSDDLKTLGNYLVIKPLSDGLLLSFGYNLLFTPGSADIREEMIPILDKIGRFISVSSYQAYIDGYTDNIPPKGRAYASNEELSIARAFSVRDYLVQLEDINPDLIALTGYGDLKPVASNSLFEGRESNRRVDIILKNQRYF